MQELSLAVICYLLGSVPFSYIFSRLLGGVDIRAKGTGNIGATNVLRTVGIKIAILALLGDLFKGLVAAWIGLRLGGPNLAALCALSAVVGHCWPIFLKFKGGKGAATGAGAIIMLMPAISVLLASTFVIIIALTRYVSLGSICGATVLPLAALLTHQPWSYVLLSFLLSSMVIYRHRGNIERLWQGSERKIGEKVV